MKIDLLEPFEQNVSVLARIKKIHSLLKQLGYEVVERNCGPALFERVRRDHPFVVFNLSSIYGWEKTNLIPAVLEIAGVRYTGSGMLGLSLARNYTRLFPLFLDSGIRVPVFHIIETGDSARLKGHHYPLRLYLDGEKNTLFLRNDNELNRILKKLPAHEKILLLDSMIGKRVSQFILDNKPFLGTPGSSYLGLAQKAYRTLEARGLARFDFIQGSQPVLVKVDIAPDPLDEDLLYEAALSGWDAGHLLQLLVEHSGNDL